VINPLQDTTSEDGKSKCVCNGELEIAHKSGSAVLFVVPNYLNV
jgi:hypothetical protein